MHFSQSIEHLLAQAIQPSSSQVPPRLQAAIHHAVFPGGARFRPQLIAAISHAYGDPHPELRNAIAITAELFHCASLVHDDLPCFDNANTRRGRPSVQRAFGEEMAVLVGDALIVLAFENLALRCPTQLLPTLIRIFSAGIGMNGGIIAGQAWESETACNLYQYHQAKTGALFIACARSAALACDANETDWVEVGKFLGEAYQVADDLYDACTSKSQAFFDKPKGQDAHLGRPNIVLTLGLPSAVDYFYKLIDQLLQTVPNCLGRAPLQSWILDYCKGLIAPVVQAKSFSRIKLKPLANTSCDVHPPSV